MKLCEGSVVLISISCGYSMDGWLMSEFRFNAEAGVKTRLIAAAAGEV
jgi:hypothetical protein